MRVELQVWQVRSHLNQIQKCIKTFYWKMFEEQSTASTLGAAGRDNKTMTQSTQANRLKNNFTKRLPIQSLDFTLVGMLNMTWRELYS